MLSRMDPARKLTLRGTDLLNQGEYERALAAWQEAARIRPDSAEIHNRIGIAQTKLGRYDQARESFLAADRLDPAGAESRFNLGALLLHQKKYPEARGELREALARCDWYPGAHDLAGYSYKEQARLAPSDAEQARLMSLADAERIAEVNVNVASKNAWVEVVDMGRQGRKPADAVRVDPGAGNTIAQLAAWGAVLGIVLLLTRVAVSGYAKKMAGPHTSARL